MSNFKVHADIKNNLLKITFANDFKKRDLERLYTDVRFAVADMQPGFIVIADYSDCNLVNLDSLPVFGKLIQFLISNNVSEVIRILPKTKLFKTQIINFTSQCSAYHPIVTYTADDAKKILDTIIPRKGIRLFPKNYLVTYRSGKISATACLSDISYSGCAIITRSDLPENDAIIALEFNSPEIRKSGDVMQIQGRVVRVDAKGFAVQFSDSEKERNKDFWALVVEECKKQISDL